MVLVDFEHIYTPEQRAEKLAEKKKEFEEFSISVSKVLNYA